MGGGDVDKAIGCKFGAQDWGKGSSAPIGAYSRAVSGHRKRDTTEEKQGRDRALGSSAPPTRRGWEEVEGPTKKEGKNQPVREGDKLGLRRACREAARCPPDLAGGGAVIGGLDALSVETGAPLRQVRGDCRSRQWTQHIQMALGGGRVSGWELTGGGRLCGRRMLRRHVCVLGRTH